MKNIWLFTAHIKNQLDIDKKRLNLFSHFLIISDYLSWATDFFHLLQNNKRIIYDYIHCWGQYKKYHGYFKDILDV